MLPTHALPISFASNCLNRQIGFTSSENFFFNLGSQDAIVALSGQLKERCSSCDHRDPQSDLRWMNSGHWLAEIKGLQALHGGLVYHAWQSEP